MTDTAPPLHFIWTGEVMRPRSAKLAEKHFTRGESYVLEPYRGRSKRSHDHFFASLHEAWKNLPEQMTEQYPTDDHLRKRALIETGYRDERSIVCASKAEARRVAAFIEPMDDYAVVIVRQCVVIVFTAKSQSKKAMGAKEFAASKNAVLDWCSALLAVGRDDLEKARAA